MYEVLIGATNYMVVGDCNGVHTASRGLEHMHTLQRTDVPDLRGKSIQTISQKSISFIHSNISCKTCILSKERVQIHKKINKLLVENYTTHNPVERFSMDQPIRELTVTKTRRRVPKKLSSHPLSGAGE